MRLPPARERFDALIASIARPAGAFASLWLEGGKAIAFVDASAGGPGLRIADAATGEIRWSVPGLVADLWPLGATELAFRIGDARRAVSTRTGAVRDLSSEEASALALRIPRVAWRSYPATRPNEMELPSPDGTLILSLATENVVVRSTATGEERALTFDGTPEYRWSLEQARWSPDSRFVALKKVDERHVFRVPVTDWTSDTLETKWQVYPRPGGPMMVPHLHVIEVATGRAMPVPGDDENSYASILGFSADSRTLRYARMPRTSKMVELFSYDVASGDVRLLLRETSDTFLYWPASFMIEGLPVRFLADGRFIWLSEQSGWNHLYLHAPDGRLERQLTGGTGPVTSTAGVDEAEGAVFYRAQPDPQRPYDIHIMKVGLDGGAPVQLSRDRGTHEARLSPDGKHYVDLHSANDRPPCAELRDAQGKLISVLWEADICRLNALGWRAPEEFKAKAADGETDLYGVIYKPFDFDPEKSYPVLECIYAGAQVSVVPNSFDGGMRGQQAAAFAQLGYIVVMLDGRGTPGRGKAFHDVVYRRLGDFEIADHAGAIRQAAATRPYMDLDRVGIFGGSFGGYFSVRALILAGDLYKAAAVYGVAELGTLTLGPVVEGYMGLPQDNAAHYARTLNTDKLAEVTGEVLFVIGTDDVNTPFGQTLLYADAFRRLNKAVDVVVLPGFNHAPMNAAGEMPLGLLHDALARHFERTLKPSA